MITEELVNGRKATVAYLTGFGGSPADPSEATFAVVTFADGGVLYLAVAPETDEEETDD